MSLLSSRKVQILGCLSACATILVLFSLNAPSETLDVKFFYSREYAKNFFLNLQPMDRMLYTRTEEIDFAFIIAYTALARFLTASYGSSLLNRFAFAPGLLDLVETSTIYWNLRFGTVGLTYLGAATAAKWTCGAILMLWFFWRVGATFVTRRFK